jgi:hypothetical protein
MRDRLRERAAALRASARGTSRGKTLIRRFLRLSGASTGQALPLALVALALGGVLVSPFLVNASVNLLASRNVDSAISDYYSADAGVEWALWHLKNDPTLTTNTECTDTPLQPTPAAINGEDFPTTEICYVSGAGVSETITPAWQGGGGAKCYDFTSSDDGNIFAIVDVVNPGNVWITLLTGSEACVRPGGLGTMGGDPPYSLQFSDRPAGSYRLLVQTAPPRTGDITINYPVASYDIRSERNGRTITSRATASANLVRIVSWQLE